MIALTVLLGSERYITSWARRWNACAQLITSAASAAYIARGPLTGNCVCGLDTKSGGVQDDVNRTGVKVK